MIEKILLYERDAFFALNGSDSAFLDRFMWLYTGKEVWLPLAILIIGVLVYKKNWRESLLIILAIALVVLLCDQFASHVCKPLFTRFRPTHHPDFMEQVKTVFNYRGGLYGFISSHAANAFGFATLMALIMKNRWFGMDPLFVGYLDGLYAYLLRCSFHFGRGAGHGCRHFVWICGLSALSVCPFEVVACGVIRCFPCLF